MSEDNLNTHSPIHKDEEEKGNAYVPHSLLKYLSRNSINYSAHVSLASTRHKSASHHRNQGITLITTTA